MFKLKLIGNVKPPKYQSERASGFDVEANRIHSIFDGTVKLEEDKLNMLQEKFNTRKFINLRPGERITFGTGLILADMEAGYELQVRSRSGIATKKGLIVTNQPGTIDADYRGEILVSITNNTKYLNAVYKNSRIAQIVCQKVEKPIDNDIPIVDEIVETVRGESGFGSTGK